MPTNLKLTAAAAAAFTIALAGCSPSSSAADDPPNAKDCIFTLAAKLPAAPGMVIKSAAATAELPQNAGYGLKENWKVVIEVEAIGRRATYAGQCGYTEEGRFAYPPTTPMIVK